MANEATRQKVRILLVDDKKENLISLEQLLLEHDNSLEIIKVTSGQEALKVAFFEDLALILLDVQMPEMDGYEVARLLKGNTRTGTIPIIFVTASNQDTFHILQGYETGAVDYLFKPLNPEITKAKVRSFVRMYRQQKELEKLTNLVNNSLDLMCLLEEDSLKFMAANPAWETQLGYNPGDLVGKFFYDYVFCKSEEHTGKTLRQEMNGKTRLTDFETCVFSNDKSRRFILWSFVLKQGVWYCNGREFTERKNAEDRLQIARSQLINLNTELEDRVKKRTEELRKKNEELQRINTDLDNFIYTASHDLKAPISNIEGLVSALNGNCTENEETYTLMRMINQSIERFKKVIYELTNMARAQSEEVSDEEVLDFRKISDDVKEDMKDLIDKNRPMITEDYSQVPVILFSRKNLRSILYNLLSNAIKYRSPLRTPHIHISTSRLQDNVLLTVQDNGLGIKEEDKPKVFSMFKRLHDHVEGTGMGMSLVKRIVDNSGGKIEVDSVLGKGTTFRVFFKNR